MSASHKWLIAVASVGVALGAPPPRQQNAGRTLVVDATRPTRDRKIWPRHVGQAGGGLPEGAAPAYRLRLRLVLADRTVRPGATLSVKFILTNLGTNPLTVPISPNSADIEPPKPLAAGYKFSNLIFSVSMPGTDGSLFGASLYGAPSTSGTTRTLRPGDSLVVLADVRVQPMTGPPFRPGLAYVSASAYLDKVTDSPSGNGLSEFRAEVASATSPRLQLRILPAS